MQLSPVKPQGFTKRVLKTEKKKPTGSENQCVCVCMYNWNLSSVTLTLPLINPDEVLTSLLAS